MSSNNSGNASQSNPAANSAAGASAAGASTTNAPPKPAGNPKFVKYKMMTKLGLPEGAIRQKMLAEGLTSEEVDTFFAS